MNGEDETELREGVREGVWDRGSLEFGRVLNLSDGVFGFALTLLVAGITVPTLAGGQSLADGIGDQAPAIIAFGITVVLIGRFWMAHHAQWATYGQVVPAVMFLNVVYLGSIAFLPFPMAVLGRYDGQTAAVVLQALALAVVSVLEVIVDWWAERSGCLRIHRTAAERRHNLVAGLAPAVVFAASIPLAFVNGVAAMYSWLLIIPVEVAITRFLDPDRRSETS